MKKRWKALIYKLLDFICYWQFFLENIWWLFWFLFVSCFLDRDKKRPPWTKLACLRMVCKPVRNNRCIIESTACYDYNHCCSWFMVFLTWSDMSPQNTHARSTLFTVHTVWIYFTLDTCKPSLITFIANKCIKFNLQMNTLTISK